MRRRGLVTAAEELAVSKTYWDMAQVERDESWRLIRQARSHSSVAVADRPTYTAALEQAEELFGAAQQLGPATRALPLFYGLSQAGRALAIAIEPGTRFSGHGIGMASTQPGKGEPLLERVAVKGRKEPTSAFGSLSALLSSSPMLTAQNLSFLWGMVKETQTRPPRYATEVPCLDVEGDELRLWSISGIPAQDEPMGDDDHRRLQLAYPGLAGTTLRGFGSSDTDWLGRRTTTMHVARIGDSGGVLPPLGTPYRTGRVLMPSVGSNPETLHPLMLWWSILFALSMLTRYEPDTWTRLIDIDESSDAIHVEALLEYSLDTVPDLIHRTLRSALEGEKLAGS